MGEDFIMQSSVSGVTIIYLKKWDELRKESTDVKVGGAGKLKRPHEKLLFPLFLILFLLGPTFLPYMHLMK